MARSSAAGDSFEGLGNQQRRAIVEVLRPGRYRSSPTTCPSVAGRAGGGSVTPLGQERTLSLAEHWKLWHDGQERDRRQGRARRRQCSRQHLQVLINRLVAERMAELVTNPDHRRSRLVRLTDRGRETLEAMWKREAELVDELPITLSPGELATTARALQELRQLLPEAPGRPRSEDHDGPK